MQSLRRPCARYLLVLLAFGALGCGAEAPHDEPYDGPLGEAVQAQTVAEAAGSSCSTLSVKGLSDQIITVGNCVSPGAFVMVPDLPNLSVSETVFPYLEQPARDAFVACLMANSGMTMSVNSMLRTVAQQYLLYHWYESQQCGIGLAATPGSSNHETGLAFDADGYVAWKSTLADHGFQWFGDADPVHFDYVGADAVSYKGTDVLAFQKLWNANNPGDIIDEDGDYGPQTEARLQVSPAEGFASVPGCGPEYAAELVSDTYPMIMEAGETADAQIVVKNIGTKTWGSDTHLGTTMPRDRESLFAAADWPAPDRLTGVSGSVAPGEQYTFSFELQAPLDRGSYVEHWNLVEEHVAWFSDQGGPADDAIAFQITVVSAPEPSSAEASTSSGAGGAAGDDSATADAGGCSCGLAPRPSRAPVGALAAVAFGLALARRRSLRRAETLTAR